MFKKSIPLFIALVTVGLPTLTMAAPQKVMSDRVGNGGFAHVCRDAAGKITSARLLDLWEAESLGAYSSNAPVDIQIEDALRKLESFSPNAYRYIGYYYDSLKKTVVMSDRPLSKTDDAFPPYEPGAGCSYEQVARFESSLTELGVSGLRINSEIYQSPFFTNSDRAALMIHEAIYLVDRMYNGAENSQRTRTLTGHLFSASNVPNAVRMLFVYLYGSHESLEGTGKRLTILVLPNPAQASLKVAHFFEIDGKSKYGLSKADGKVLYRCTLGLNNEDPTADTGYQALSKIMGADPTNALELKATIGVAEFVDLDPSRRRNRSEVLNISWAQCFKRNAKGKEIPVPFSAEVAYDDAECLIESSGGSFSVAKGNRCNVAIEATAETLKKYSSLDANTRIGVTQAL